jgi:hypothetical protein
MVVPGGELSLRSAGCFASMASSPTNPDAQWGVKKDYLYLVSALS